MNQWDSGCEACRLFRGRTTAVAFKARLLQSELKLGDGPDPTRPSLALQLQGANGPWHGNAQARNPHLRVASLRERVIGAGSTRFAALPVPSVSRDCGLCLTLFLHLLLALGLGCLMLGCNNGPGHRVDVDFVDP